MTFLASSSSSSNACLLYIKLEHLIRDSSSSWHIRLTDRLPGYFRCEDLAVLRPLRTTIKIFVLEQELVKQSRDSHSLIEAIRVVSKSRFISVWNGNSL